MTSQTQDRTGQDEATIDVPPGKLGMWIFLCSDGLGFTGLLAAYAALRFKVEGWPGKMVDGAWEMVPGTVVPDFLNIPLTALATFVLICSSATMVQALSAAKAGDEKKLRLYLGATILGGVLFLGFQAFEWGHFIHQGFLPSTSVFWGTFFAITGYHGLHVLAGVIYLSCLEIGALRGSWGPEKAGSIEVAGLYWHFVDLVWILIFTFIYLL